jgi:hypothetical protein
LFASENGKRALQAMLGDIDAGGALKALLGDIDASQRCSSDSSVLSASLRTCTETRGTRMKSIH